MSDAPDGVATPDDAIPEKPRPPRDNLVRAMHGGVTVRQPDASRAEDDEPSANENGMPTMVGHYATFNDWYEVNSFFEGHFLERIAPGASKKTTREHTPIVLYNHGQDAVCGDKPLGPVDVLREDDNGPYYEVPLLDASYVRDLVPALEAGLLGASFRFSVMREEWVDKPPASDDNPTGLPERTIKEMRVSEFGPVSFPANPAASAGVRSTGMRSMTDEYLMAQYTSEPDGLRSILEYLEQRDSRPVREAAAVTDEAAAETVTDTERDEAPDEAAEAAAVTETAETRAPGQSPTPLFGQKGSRSATPGPSPTSLYTGKSKKNRKGWVL